MKTFQLTVHDKLAIIALDRGRSNPINHQMVTELLSAVWSLENDESIAGLILTGKEGFFSSGVDLIEAYNYNEVQAKRFWTDFLILQETLIKFKKPLVAAISGHSPAGGCLLAICCDYRVMAAGEFIIGLNEIPVGIVVPDFVFSLYSLWIGERKAYQLLLEGKLLKVDDALSIGLIDELVAPENVLPRAEKKISAYLQLNPETWSQSKLNLRKGLIEKIGTNQSETLDCMLKQWWAPETRAGLLAMVQNLQSKNTPVSH